jgi:transposase-like protein
MSKIPQGEWNAIAARYAKGDSITRIAQTYGCTPPAIHYILKRYKQRATHNPEQKLNGTPGAPTILTGEVTRRPMAPEISRDARPLGEERGAARPAPAEIRATSGQFAELRSERDREVSPLRPTPSNRAQPAVPQQHQANSRHTARATAFTAGLDDELHGRAEAAIAAFRSSFDAALAEGSQHVRQRLRQAASDLMRVAARTTIVLDRLNATTERASGLNVDQFRSGHGQ